MANDMKLGKSSSEEVGQHLSALKSDGFTILRGHFDSTFMARYKRILETLYRQRVEEHGPLYPDGVGSTERLLLNLQAKHDIFLDTLSDPLILAIVGFCLREGSYKCSESFVLSQYTARDPHFGAARQQMHVDARYVGAPFPLCVVSLLAVDDLLPETGATWVVPGSHRRLEYPPDGVYPNDAVQLSMNSGDVLLFDGGLWHGGGAKQLEIDRWVAIATFSRWFLKQSFDIPSTFSEIQKSRLSAMLKEILGFNCITPNDELKRVRARSKAD